jgi:hypothetical protein
MTTDVDTSGRIPDVRQTISLAMTAYGANLPAAEQAAAVSALAMTSPVDCLMGFAEAGYSAIKFGGVTDAATIAAMAQAVGQAANQAVTNGWSHIDATCGAGTTCGIFAWARRTLGATTTPEASADPARPPQFVPAQPMTPPA